MNRWTQWFLVAIFATACIGQRQGGNGRGKKYSPYRYITNWAQYGKPEEIGRHTLMKILTKIAAFMRNNNYCSLGPSYNDCYKENLNEVISKIIDETLGGVPSVGRTINAYEDKNLIQVVSASADMGKVHNKQVRCRCNQGMNKEKKIKHKKTKLALSRYKFLKVNPIYQKRPSFNRNKPFGKIIGDKD